MELVKSGRFYIQGFSVPSMNIVVYKTNTCKHRPGTFAKGRAKLPPKPPRWEATRIRAKDSLIFWNNFNFNKMKDNFVYYSSQVPLIAIILIQ